MVPVMVMVVPPVVGPVLGVMDVMVGVGRGLAVVVNVIVLV